MQHDATAISQSFAAAPCGSYLQICSSSSFHEPTIWASNDFRVQLVTTSSAPAIQQTWWNDVWGWGEISTQVNPQCFDPQCYQLLFRYQVTKGPLSGILSHQKLRFDFLHIQQILLPSPRLPAPPLSTTFTKQRKLPPTFHWLKRICVSPAQASLQSPRIF